MSTIPACEQDMVRRACEALGRALEMTPQEVPGTAAQGNFEKWDSLGHLSVVMEVESEFGVSFSTDEALGLRSIADIVKAVKQHLHGH